MRSRNLYKIYIIKTIETKLEKNDNVYFKLKKKLNYFLNVKFIAYLLSHTHYFLIECLH